MTANAATGPAILVELFATVDITQRARQIPDAFVAWSATKTNSKADIAKVIQSQGREYARLFLAPELQAPPSEHERTMHAAILSGEERPAKRGRVATAADVHGGLSKRTLAEYVREHRRSSNAIVAALRGMKHTLFKEHPTDPADPDKFVAPKPAIKTLETAMCDPYKGFIKTLANRTSARNTRRRDQSKRARETERQRVEQRQRAAWLASMHRVKMRAVMLAVRNVATDVTIADPATGALHHMCGRFRWASTREQLADANDRWVAWNSVVGVVYNSERRQVRVVLLGGASGGERPMIAMTPEDPATAPQYASALLTETSLWLVQAGAGVTRVPVMHHLHGDSGATHEMLGVRGGCALASLHDGAETLVMACAKGILVWPLSALDGVRCIVGESFAPGQFHRAKPLKAYVPKKKAKSVGKIAMREWPLWMTETGGAIPVCSASVDTIAYQRGTTLWTLQIPIIGVELVTLNASVVVGEVAGTLLAGRIDGETTVASTTDGIWVFPGDRAYLLPKCTTSTVVDVRHVWRDATYYAYADDSSEWTVVPTE